jgi:hypothetical protein
MTKPIPNKLLKCTPTIHIHGNGQGRKRKVMVSTPQGMFSARRYYYKMYHPRWDGKGKVIHLNNNDLDFSKSNLMLLTTRECNNLVHFNNNHIINNNPQLQREVIYLIRSGIAVEDLRKEVQNHEENTN